MAKSNAYEWSPGGAPAILKQHSRAKHEVLRSYLVAYLQTLVSSPSQDEIRVTMVDGFAGGGVYRHETTGELLLGSPFQFLEAAVEAQALMNPERHKPLVMNLDYFFVEEDPGAVAYLRQALKERGYGQRLGQDIRLLEGRFEQHVQGIQEFIKRKSPRKGRSVFLLDQYGYTDVPMPLIQQLLQFPAAEVILTFAVDALINYAGDTAQTRGTLERLGMPEVLRGRTFADIKSNERDFRLFIQSCLYRDLVEGCGASYYTVFFIRTEGYGDYWLVHLSQHPRARDVMTQVHWKHNNSFVHYGGAGINMFTLGYLSGRDVGYTGQHAMDFLFDDSASERTASTLMEQLPHLIFARDEGLDFEALYAATCNTSPADSEHYKRAVERLIHAKEVEVVSPNGSRKTKASTIRGQDRIVPSRQLSLLPASRSPEVGE